MNQLHTSLLATEELTVATARLLPLITPLIAGQPIPEAIALSAEKHRAAIVLAASRQLGSNFTESLLNLDATRDAAFTALRDFANTYAKHPIATPELRAAAARLVQTIAHHGNTLHRLGYTRQSGKLNALIADLTTIDSTADLTTLDLLPLFTNLTTAQSDFENLVAEKAAVEGGIELPTTYTHRPELERQLNLLLDMIEEWHDLVPTPATTAAIAKMDEIITTISTPALARRSKAKSDPTSEKPNPEPPPAS
jgi:hypothetical protein